MIRNIRDADFRLVSTDKALSAAIPAAKPFVLGKCDLHPESRKSLSSGARDSGPGSTYKLLLVIWLVGLVALPGCRQAVQEVREQRVHYLDTSTFVLARVLPPPPANNSAETRAELDEMLRIQASRTREQSDRALADVDASVFRFADVVDAERFTAQRLPITATFFKNVTEDEVWAAGEAKNVFNRPRPFLLETRLQPLISRPVSASYPSGHATWAFAVGFILADMLPEKREALMVRAREFARNRVVVGVHYPSDVESGALAGSALAAALFASPKFRTDQAAATRELRAALGLPPMDP